MTEINAKIFKKYDIRGLAEGDNAVITPDVARQIGQAFGTYIQRFENQQRIAVGHDNRRSSPTLYAAVIEGIKASGCAVFDIGLVATPILYWYAVHYGNLGGLMITGSHLKPDQNGFKVCVGNRPIYGGQIKLLQSLIENNNLAFGEGTVTADQSAYSKYIHDIEKRVRMKRALHIVVDAGNGMGGLFAPRLFQLWGHHVTHLYCEPDGNFPNHQPDPQEPENLRDLGKMVMNVGADLGIAFDGDADRMGAVDENGDVVTADRLLVLLARDMLSRNPGAAVVADVLSSQVLFDEVAKAGGKPVMAPSGHSLVKDEMRNQDALLGGEMSGHMFLAEDYYGFDDAFLAAGRLLQLLAAGKKPLSELNASIPSLYSTPEYRPHCPDEDKDTVIDRVAKALGEMGDVVTVDGLRIKFPRGWGLLRASNTEPVLSLRFEGETDADAKQIKTLFVEALRAYPQVEKIED
jgi:phosphomannomutase/phosphoglucomutase